MRVAMTIAGSDPSGGAGLQADLKTFHQHGVYGMSAVTLVTVQNTRAVSKVVCLDASLVAEQVSACMTDIPPHAIKCGALGEVAIVRAIAESLEGCRVPVVVDPVMISKHGHALLAEDAIEACTVELFPRATLVTPNLPEAERILGRAIGSLEAQRTAARDLAARWGNYVLVKGGHTSGPEAIDVLAGPGSLLELRAPFITTRHTHGTGCTLSAAITARLALGHELGEAIRGAKAWLGSALGTAPGLGHGIGPLNHFAPVEH